MKPQTKTIFQKKPLVGHPSVIAWLRLVVFSAAAVSVRCSVGSATATATATPCDDELLSLPTGVEEPGAMTRTRSGANLPLSLNEIELTVRLIWNVVA